MEVNLKMVIRNFEQHLLNIDFNKSSKVCEPCALECEKINKKVNNRKLSDIKDNLSPKKCS